MHRRRSWTLPALMLLLGAPSLRGQTKIAEGEYFSRQEFKAGPVADTMEARESWILSRLEDGGFEVEGKGRVTWKNPAIPAEETAYRLRLTQDFHIGEVLGLTIQGSTMSCELGATEVVCRKNGRTARLSIEQPYDMLTGNIWFLGSIARRAGKRPGAETEVRIVIADEPFGLGSFKASIRFVGAKEHETAAGNFLADEFLLSAGDFPSFRIFMSPEGIPLSAVTDGDVAPPIELVRFRKLPGF